MDTDVLLDELARGRVDAERSRTAEQMSFDELIAPHASETNAKSSDSPAAVSRRTRNGYRSKLPVSGRHQDLRLYLTVLLKTFVEMKDAGLVREAPYRVQISEKKWVEPDILFVSNMNFDRVHDSYLEGPPDVVVEITSPESTAADRGEKFVLYETIGVREYWLIDPVREMVSFYHLGPDNHYTEFRPDMAGRYNSRILRGFVLEVDRLWKRVLPTTEEIVDMARTMSSPH